MRVLAILALSAAPAFAETPCLPSLDEYAAALEKGWAEVPQIIGTMARGGAFIVFANPATGSWTVVIEAPDGRFCSPASGENYVQAPQGEPT